MTPEPELIHPTPETAITEGEFVQGTSLWRDAWRRLLKNKLAVFGLVVVVLITTASVIGPTFRIIAWSILARANTPRFWKTR